MNLLTIVGVIFIGLGTLLTIVGQQRASRMDLQAADKKVSQVLTRLDDLQAGSLSPAQRDSLGHIEDEFRNWAADFLATVPDRKVRLAQQQLQATSQELEQSRILRPIYQSGLDALAGRLRALREQGGPQITAQLPPLPDNLYAPSAPYQALIVFNPLSAWGIRLSSSSGDNGPSLNIVFGKVEEVQFGITSNMVVIIPDLKNGRLITSLEGPMFAAIRDIAGPVKLTTARTELPTILTKVLEFQLLRLQQ